MDVSCYIVAEDYLMCINERGGLVFWRVVAPGKWNAKGVRQK